MSGTDWVTVIGAFMTPITVMFLAWLQYTKSARIEKVTTQTRDIAVEVDRAVNGRVPRTSTISDDVSTIMAKQEADSPSDAAPGLVTRFEQFENLLKRLLEDMQELKQTNGTNR